MIFPIKTYKYYLPVNKEKDPGAFGAIRRHDIHTGIDLYCEDKTPVYAIEDGVIYSMGNFTGYNESPWWNDTQYVQIKGKSGHILYGEITYEGLNLFSGKEIKEGELIGFVKTVLKKDKGNAMSMLHLELYREPIENPSEVVGPVWWKLNDKQPEHLLDITPLLLKTLNKI